MKKTRWSIFATLAMLAVVALSACDSGTSTPTQPTPTAGAAIEVQPPANAAELATLSGEVVIDGSSTVYPITAAASEEFNQYAKDVRIPVGISGTGGGFKKLCAGELDIQDASRPISPSEVELCKEKNIEYIEIPVAFDGLAVVVNPNNTFVDYLSVAELKKVWEPSAEELITSTTVITSWNQLRDSFPNQRIKLYGPGTDSGTFDYFTEAIVGKAKSSRGDYTPSEDDNLLVTGVAGDEYALGYFGYAYVIENAGKVKALPVGDSKETAVAPSIETVKNGTYQPLSRPLFIYIRKESAARPEVKAFVEYYLSKSFTPLIQSREVGYITLDDELYTAVTKRFQDGTLGTLFPNGTEVGTTLDRYLPK